MSPAHEIVARSYVGAQFYAGSSTSPPEWLRPRAAIPGAIGRNHTSLAERPFRVARRPTANSRP